MTRARRLLIVTDVFPPIAAVGTQRTVALCRHLAQHKWRTAVITARPRARAPIDRTLLERIPEGVEVIRTRCPDLPAMAARLRRGSPSELASAGDVTVGNPSVSPGAVPCRPGTIRQIVQWLSWWMYVPDSRSAWLPFAVAAGLRAARRLGPEAVYSTAPRFTSHLVGGILARRLGVPWIADFQDPWCGNPYRELPHGIHQRIDERLERWVVRSADRIPCAWDGIRCILGERYPDRADRIRTFLIGFEPAVIDPVTPEVVEPGRCVLLHAGVLYGPRSPVPVFEGLQRLRREQPEQAERVLVILLGSPTWGGRRVERVAEQYGVADLVRVMPRVAHRQAVAYLKGADVAILFGQGGPGHLSPVPAKVYEYVGTGKVVLAIGTGQEAADILRRGGCRLWQADVGRPESVAEALGRIADAYTAGDLAPREPSAARLTFTRTAMAEGLAAMIDEAVREVGEARAAGAANS